MKSMLIAFILILGALNASEVQDSWVKRVFFDGHSYIVIDYCGIVHDPDCGCQDQWICIPLDKDAYMIRRMHPSNQD